MKLLREKRKKGRRERAKKISCYWGFKIHSLVSLVLFCLLFYLYLKSQQLFLLSFSRKRCWCFSFYSKIQRHLNFFWMSLYPNAEILAMLWWQGTAGCPQLSCRRPRWGKPLFCLCCRNIKCNWKGQSCSARDFAPFNRKLRERSTYSAPESNTFRTL